ncbi:MAG TPA: hypothetical protein VKU84_01860 [Stellaceae bacterium]|nr:hypothetical protein [Stellaceae bacterium]
MLGVGFFKLVFLAGAVAGVWYLFKMLAGPSAPPPEPEAQAPQRPPKTAARNRADAEDMVACKVCGTYVSANGARSCGRPDCPWRG